MTISIHPPRAGRDPLPVALVDMADISIHPPRAGRDPLGAAAAALSAGFQSTRPVRGGTLPEKPKGKNTGKFQSTRPVRGGTHSSKAQKDSRQISIHPPRAGRDDIDKKLRDLCDISIHPPRAGRDGLILLSCCLLIGFQSTRPVRGGTGVNIL